METDLAREKCLLTKMLPKVLTSKPYLHTHTQRQYAQTTGAIRSLGGKEYDDEHIWEN